MVQSIVKGIRAKRRTTQAGFFLVIAVFLASAAQAQQVARWEVFGGYSNLRFDTTQLGYADYSYLNGWNASVTGNINRKFGIALDGSGNYGSGLSAYHFMIGPQYTWRRDRSKFFAHVLFGKADDHLSVVEPQPFRDEFTSVGLAVAGGGGFDWYINKRITFRVVQADYLHTHTFGATEQNVRVSTGLLFQFGAVRRHRK